MEKVLLAIDGIHPDQKAFGYALQLCRRIKAELSIFQIIRPQTYRRYLKKIRQNTDQARQYFESAMVAATFAEAGEHETAQEIMAEASAYVSQLLPASQAAGVACNLTVVAGNPVKEIVKYLRAHRDVVLAIYDAADHATGLVRLQPAVPGRIQHQLSVPLVVVNNSKL